MAHSKKSHAGLHEQIARKLESRILTGELRPGDCIPSEERLGREFSASRTVIREALQAMKTRGLLQSRRGSGTYVAEPGKVSIRESLSWFAELQQDDETFVELMDLRILVETHCVRRLATGSAPLQSIRQHLKDMDNNLRDLARFAEADIGFHLSIAEASGHSLFNEVAKAVLPALGRPFARQTHTDIQLAEQSLVEHREIFVALKARDPEKAEGAMWRHLQRSRRSLLDRIARSSPENATPSKKLSSRPRRPPGRKAVSGRVPASGKN